MKDVLDLNIEQMRADVHRQIAEALKPFYVRLTELDVLESVLSNHSPRRPFMIPTLEVPSKSHEAFLGGGTMHADKPFINLSQTKAVTAILTSSPGLSTLEITKAMKDGGFPFSTNSPRASIQTLIRQMENKGLVKAQRPAANAVDKTVTYTVASGKTKTNPRDRNGGISINQAILTVLQKDSGKGMTRGEVYDALVQEKYVFGPTSDPRRSVTWSLQTLLTQEKITRVGQGYSAIFEVKKP